MCSYVLRNKAIGALPWSPPATCSPILCWERWGWMTLSDVPSMAAWRHGEIVSSLKPQFHLELCATLRQFLPYLWKILLMGVISYLLAVANHQINHKIYVYRRIAYRRSIKSDSHQRAPICSLGSPMDQWKKWTKPVPRTVFCSRTCFFLVWLV